MKAILIILCLPLLAWLVPVAAQPLQFTQETDSLPLETGGWQPFAPWAGGDNEICPAFCDIDADGDLDLFEGGHWGKISYFQNIGTPQQAHYQLITRQYAGINLQGIYLGYRAAPQFVDIDADGDYDLFSGDGGCSPYGYGHIHYWRNVGTPQQAQFILITDSLGGFNTLGQSRLAFCDIDGDGDYDLFSGSYYGTLSFFRNDGTPQNFSFTHVTDLYAGIQVNGYSNPTFYDIDGDGDADLFIGDNGGHVWFYRNTGTPQNALFSLVTDNFLGLDVGTLAAPVFADIDADGDQDFFCGCGAEYFSWGNSTPNDVYCYTNIGGVPDPAFQVLTRRYTQLDMGWMANLSLVDLDGDGDLDLITSLVDNLRWIQNVGDSANPVFSVQETNIPNVSTSNISTAFGDLDGDGDYDLIAGSGTIPGTPSLGLYLNQGTPQSPDFQLYSNTFITNPNFDICIVPSLADINGDGKLDLFVSDVGGHFFYYQNMGTPHWPNFVWQSNNWQGIGPTDPSSVARMGCFADLDRDGDLDFVASSDSGKSVIWYRNQGTATNPQMVLQPGTLVSPGIPGQSWSYLAPVLGDIDADGDDDVFVGNGGEDGIMFFRNVTGESLVNPKRPQGPPERMITVLPNPGNSGTTISYVLDHPQKISLDVYNLLGAKVATLASGLQLPGNYSYTWDASAKGSGIYILRFTTPDQSISRKITLLK